MKLTNKVNKTSVNLASIIIATNVSRNWRRSRPRIANYIGRFMS